jgi:catechol 2,3-dioxygenase-like lactoylglutathione lyase family enzyme
MSNKGFSHIGLSTLDLDKTRAFYEDVLGFKAVVADMLLAFGAFSHGANPTASISDAQSRVSG